MRQVILYFHLYVFIFRREYSVQKAPKFVPRRRRLGSNVDAFCTECYQPAFAWLVKTMLNKIFFFKKTQAVAQTIRTLTDCKTVVNRTL